MNETAKLSLYLFVVCAVAGLGLAGTNALTAERIQEERARKEKAAYTEVLPAAASFAPDGVATRGLDVSGNVVGYVLKVYAPGYSSRIEALAGVDLDYRITGVKILFQNETPGLGTKIALPGFTNQFREKTADAIKLRKSGGEIDAITAATISSRAITDAVREAVDKFKAAAGAAPAGGAASTSSAPIDGMAVDTRVTATAAEGAR